MGGGSSILRPRHVADPGCKEHEDDPDRRAISTVALPAGDLFFGSQSPHGETVLLRLRRWQVVRMVVAKIRFNGVFLQMFLDMCPLSFSLVVFASSCCNLICYIFNGTWRI